MVRFLPSALLWLWLWQWRCYATHDEAQISFAEYTPCIRFSLGILEKIGSVSSASISECHCFKTCSNIMWRNSVWVRWSTHLVYATYSKFFRNPVMVSRTWRIPINWLDSCQALCCGYGFENDYATKRQWRGADLICRVYAAPSTFSGN